MAQEGTIENVDPNAQAVGVSIEEMARREAIKRLWTAYEPLWVLIIGGSIAAVIGVVILKWYQGRPVVG